MPRTRIPYWKSDTSTIKNPVLLYEGRSARFVDGSEVSANPNGGRSILVRWLPSTNVKTDNGQRTVKTARRLNSPQGLRDQSVTMSPQRPTNGDIATSGYGNLLDDFNSVPSKRGPSYGTRLFRRWRGAAMHAGKDKDGRPIWRRIGVTGRVSESLLQETRERAILFMPSAGKLESRGLNNAAPRDRIRGNVVDGFEVYDSDLGWTEIETATALDMLERNSATLAETIVSAETLAFLADASL